MAVSYMDGRFCLFVDDKETPLATVISSLWCRDESVAMVDSPSSSKVFDLSAPFVSSEDGVSSSSIFDRFAAQKTFLVNLWTSGSQKLASLLSHISGQSSLLSTPEDLSSTMRGSNRKKIDREFGLVSATLYGFSLELFFAIAIFHFSFVPSFFCSKPLLFFSLPLLYDGSILTLL